LDSYTKGSIALDFSPSPPLIQAETIELLEWPRLCQHLATFTATKLGNLAARHLPLGQTQAESLTLLAQTREATQLDNATAGGLNFGGIQDIGDSLERAERQGILTGAELLAIATTLAGARQLRRVIDAQDHLPVLQDLVAELRTYPDLEQAIHHCIDDRGQVADRASDKLGGIRQQLKSLRDQIYQRLQKILQRQGNAVQETIITQRSDRFVLPVKAPQKDAIPGIVHDASTSGATLYIEPHAIVDLGNRLRQAQRQEKAEEEIIRRRLSEQVAEVQTDLERLLVIVTTLDVATARARYSTWLGANPPRFIPPDEQTTLRQLRHPLLVWQAQHEQGPEVVPIDLLIDPKIRVIAITGPNTGGKTVTLKTLGLAALMAKVGLFIPAKEPVELPWFDQILADIGDEQSLEQSLSTFSGHIRRISRILDQVSPTSSPSLKDSEPTPPQPDHLSESIQELRANSPSEAMPDRALQPTALSNTLVLLDEVGAGTDPSEGSALAIALLQHLADHTRLTVATTHFGELKALKYQDERFENASVEFDDISLSPTYRLLWGIPGRSNALTIARRLGLGENIIQQAQGYVGIGSQTDVNQMIAGLEHQRKQQETKANEAAALVAQADKLHEEILRKTAALKTREQELRLQQEQAVQTAVAEARAEIAQVIRRLQKGNATAQDAQKATEAVQAVGKRHRPAPPPKAKVSYNPQVGERVRIPSLGQTAEVMSAVDEDGKLNVRFGLMKMTVAAADIESLTGEKVEPPPAKAKAAPAPPPPPPAPAVRTSKNTIDLRGMRVAESETVLEEAIASALGPIWIIHGHGTGKLKRGVQEFLKHHPQVQRFEAAEQSDGGTGVTVAHMT
jgi:DNA mismatch repair protein MutS2